MVKVNDVQELSTTRSQIYIRFAAKKNQKLRHWHYKAVCHTSMVLGASLIHSTLNCTFLFHFEPTKVH